LSRLSWRKLRLFFDKRRVRRIGFILLLFFLGDRFSGLDGLGRLWRFLGRTSWLSFGWRRGFWLRRCLCRAMGFRLLGLFSCWARWCWRRRRRCSTNFNTFVLLGWRAWCRLGHIPLWSSNLHNRVVASTWYRLWMHACNFFMWTSWRLWLTSTRQWIWHRDDNWLVHMLDVNNILDDVLGCMLDLQDLVGCIAIVTFLMVIIHRP